MCVRVCVSPTQGDIANEAVSGGAAGLAFIRVLEGGEVDCAKPIKEGLSQEQVGVCVCVCELVYVCVCARARLPPACACFSEHVLATLTESVCVPCADVSMDRVCVCVCVHVCAACAALHVPRLG